MIGIGMPTYAVKKLAIDQFCGQNTVKPLMKVKMVKKIIANQAPQGCMIVLR